MKDPGLSPLDKSVEDEANRLAAMLLRPRVLFPLRNGELLPFLEEWRHIEVAHSLNDLFKLLNSALLKQRKPFNFVPDLAEPHLPVLLNDLCIASSQHERDLRAQVPFLARSLTIHKLQVLVEDGLLHPQRF